MNTRDLNETLRSLNVGLPDDVERLKAAGYYEEAIARIDAYLAEDWTMTQNSPYSQGLCPHMDVQARKTRIFQEKKSFVSVSAEHGR